MKYKFTDFNISPYTGLTRNSWLAIGEDILGGIFSSIADIDQPMIVPRQEFEVTYPHKNAEPNVLERERRAEIFEGLTRSLFLASVLLAENPELMLNGIPVAKYYKKHILRSCTEPESPEYAGLYKDMMALEKDPAAVPYKPFQQTVETCALVVGLWASEDVIWGLFSDKEKDDIAAFLLDWAKANTVPQNWRLFNMLDLAFLHMKGYEIPRDMMREHAQAIQNLYAGNGWYRDGHSFDYYSCWAFSFYAPLWNIWYGYENEPYLAKCFEQNSNELMKTFPHMFDWDGHVIMWGRSCIYRNAATCAIDGNLLLKNPGIDPGYARRICSGALRQFYDRDDVIRDGVPAMGFYRQFTPLVQPYSCTESVFWAFKAFLCLHLPADHPFWTAEESAGDWGERGDRDLPDYSSKNSNVNGADGSKSGNIEIDGDEAVHSTGISDIYEDVLNGPGLCVSNHLRNGETILRSGKVNKRPDDLNGIWNYGKLCYNSKFPWEAGDEDISIQSQQYVIHNELEDAYDFGNLTLWNGSRGGILYRRQYFNYRLEEECHWMQAINLADFPVEEGIIRADRLRLIKKPVTITLGSYGFPDNNAKITALEKDGAKAIVLSGADSMGCARQLAMTVYCGFDELLIKKCEGTNPDSEKSIVVYGKTRQSRQYSSLEPYYLISQVITRETKEPFTEDEIFRIKEICFEDEDRTGAYGDMKIRLNSGEEKTISFDGIEGRLEM